jgi:ribosomal protein L7/L12
MADRTVYRLQLLSFPKENRVRLIKILHDELNTGLREVVQVLAHLPYFIAETASSSYVESFKSQLESIGCQVERTQYQVLSRFERMLD